MNPEPELLPMKTAEEWNKLVSSGCNAGTKNVNLGLIRQIQADATRTQKIATGTEASVCNDIAERQKNGLAKYGTSVESNPLPLKEWLQHGYEECLHVPVVSEQTIYL